MAVATAVQPSASVPADETPNETTRSTSKIEGNGALDKALDILDAIGEAPAGLSQGALADQLQLPRTTVYRLLAALIGRGLVRRDPLRRVYCLGFRCFEMARQVYAMSDLVSAAALELRALRDLTGETSYLAALEGNDVIGLERCDGAHSQRSQAMLGQRKPVYCTSQGKAILSAMEAGDETLGHLVIHRPAHGGYVCAEPVSHVADGFNLRARCVRGTGARVLASGEELSGRLTLSVER